MKIRTLTKFSGVPFGTTGTAIKDGKQFKITWDLIRSKPLVDWFTDDEFIQYLVVVKK